MLCNVKADSLGVELFGVLPSFELGYVLEPIEYMWIRPCLGLGGGAWASYVHSHESFSQPNFGRWFYGWSAGLGPGLEVMGRVPYRRESFIGLYVKAGYDLALASGLLGDEEPPDFRLGGFRLELGLRFDRRTQEGSFRM